MYIKRSLDWDFNQIFGHTLPLIKSTGLQVAVYVYVWLNTLFGFLPSGNYGYVIDFLNPIEVHTWLLLFPVYHTS
jgi:hypothetical protein